MQSRVLAACGYARVVPECTDAAFKSLTVS